MGMIIIIYVTAYLRWQPKIREKKCFNAVGGRATFKTTLKTEHVITVTIVTA